MSEKEQWDTLSVSEQRDYISHATYLIKNGYVNAKDVIELAKQIHGQSIRKAVSG